MHFTRLHLHGFKSFVEPTELDIQPGLTGIVGPNGCGKSNLVEALRWVMGENSPRRMRGADMDDVIFGGTAMRPSRNLAEVALVLDNENRTATAEYNNDDEIHVMRRIERETGSDYRINGRLVRQRDVQLLFADQATGAHSTNLVGQGQIDALIRAKPQDRRQILEEASGTAGLHARRHEAELKLKAAEQNLTRVDDVLKAYDTQLRSLKQQVRQASRYRNLAEHIRRAEASLMRLRWLEAEQNSTAMQQALQDAEKKVGELLSVVTRGNTERAEIASELPGLRQVEATAAAVVQKLTLTREQIETESRRVHGEIQTHQQRLAQARSDQQREQERRADADTAIAKLQGEQQQLTASATDIEVQMPTATQALRAVSEDVENLDRALTQAMQTLAADEARQQALRQEMSSLSTRRAELLQRREQMETQRATLIQDAAARPDLAFASALVEASEKELARRQSQAQTAEQSYRDAEQIQVQARDIAREAQAVATKLKAEADAIDTLLHHQDDETEQVIDLITVTPGLENALAVALGEALTAALRVDAPIHWRSMQPYAATPAFPYGITPIINFIQAPAAMARSLSFVGLAENPEAGERAAADLKPGQIVVSRDGWAWRWDGFTVTPKAKTATAVRLQQRNRLVALRQDVANAEADAQKAEEALSQASALSTKRLDEDRQARDALQAAFKALNDARSAYAQQEKESTAITSKIAALAENLAQLAADIDVVESRAAGIEAEMAALPDLERRRADMTDQRAKLVEQRNQQVLRQSEFDRLNREQASIVKRRAAVIEEITAWQSRLGNAAQQTQELAERIAVLESQIAQLQARPAEIDAQRGEILSQLAEAEARRREASDRLIETEQKLSVVEHQLKQDESALNQTREDRVRSEASVQAAAEHFNVLRERIREKLDCAPEDLPNIVGEPAEGEEAPNAFELEQTLGRYTRERDGMGPVNLRAEAEVQTTQGEIDKLQSEKDDLVAAIAKLRQGISQLNREARERLQNAFTLVNERFQVLFQRLFVGGKAHLELIDNDDPLNAGLEIFASPPGKKTQILSLLSGGERTLTALALLFAVFQTNPSPICVLDEAEAALDESNIGRFCALVEDIARETGTRFLIITHQRLTMAKMDRLYGVTMGEKGVSQLVSVDLAGAVALRDGGRVPVLEQAEAALEEVQAA